MAAGAPDLLAQRSETLFRLFGLYLRWYLTRRFHALRVDRAGQPAAYAGPLIVYSNHPSWWDPAVYILLSDLLFRGRASYGPMDAAALGKYGVLQRMGVFGVPQHDPRGAAIFLRTCLAVLARPGGMLWITAEGNFTDPRARPVSLRPGLAHLARRTPNAMIVPLAIEYSFWNESQPEALVRFGPPVTAPASGSVADWNTELEHALTTTMDGLAATSMTRDPSRFRPLLRGGVGIGGIYDSWRWLRATAAGRRFDPSHEGEV